MIHCKCCLKAEQSWLARLQVQVLPCISDLVSELVVVVNYLNTGQSRPLPTIWSLFVFSTLRNTADCTATHSGILPKVASKNALATFSLFIDE